MKFSMLICLPLVALYASSPVDIYVNDAGAYTMDSPAQHFVINSTQIKAVEIRHVAGSAALDFENARVSRMTHYILRDFPAITLNITGLSDDNNPIKLLANKYYGTDRFTIHLTFLLEIPNCGIECPVPAPWPKMGSMNCSCTTMGRMCHRAFQTPHCTVPDKKAPPDKNTLIDLDVEPIKLNFGIHMNVYDVPIGRVSISPSSGLTVTAVGWPTTTRTLKSSLCFTQSVEHNDWVCIEQREFINAPNFLDFRVCSSRRDTGFVYISDPHYGETPEMVNLTVTTKRTPLEGSIRSGIIFTNGSMVSFCIGSEEMIVFQVNSDGGMQFRFDLPAELHPFSLHGLVQPPAPGSIFTWKIAGTSFPLFGKYGWYTMHGHSTNNSSPAEAHVRIVPRAVAEDPFAVPFTTTAQGNTYTFASKYRVQYYWSPIPLPRSPPLIQRLIYAKSVEFSPIVQTPVTKTFDSNVYVSCIVYLPIPGDHPLLGLCTQIMLNKLRLPSHPDSPLQPLVPTLPRPQPSAPEHEGRIYVIISIIIGVAILIVLVSAAWVTFRSSKNPVRKQTNIEGLVQSDSDDLDSNRHREKPD